LIHIKSDEVAVGDKLADYLKQLPKERLALLAAYGGDKPVARLKELMPAMRVTSKVIIERAITAYMATGWTGYIPDAIRNTDILLPQKYTPWLWGWPYRFLERMKDANTRVFLVKGNGKFSEGFDNLSDLKELPANYTGGIWTNRIDRVGRVYH
jgi:glycerophosphoryl diester phosphodiesterase